MALLGIFTFLNLRTRFCLKLNINIHSVHFIHSVNKMNEINVIYQYKEKVMEFLSFGIVQDIADLIGADIGTAITPSGISILKMSLEGAEEIRKEND